VTGFGSVNPLTGQPIAGFAQSGNTRTFKRHFRKVIKTYQGKTKIIMYVDNVRFHHARMLKPFLEAHPEFEIRCLPPYSPDLNPVERVRWYMRKRITHNRYLSSLRERIAKFRQLFFICMAPNQKLKNICVINY
jgi:transposase